MIIPAHRLQAFRQSLLCVAISLATTATAPFASAQLDELPPAPDELFPTVPSRPAAPPEKGQPLYVAPPAVPPANDEPVSDEPVSAEIRLHNGRPTVFINGRPHALPAYSPVSMRREKTAVQQAARFFQHGMGAYFVTVPAIKFTEWEYFYDTPFWVGDEISKEPLAEASGSLDAQVEQILKGDPNAYIIVRFFDHEPKSWRDLHPDQRFVTEEGKALEVPSMASTLYRDMAGRFSAAIIEHCESRPWGKRIIGYANFGRMEGTHEPIIHGWLFDHSPLMTARWREFLKAKYQTVEKLRAAHSDATLTFENADVPLDRLRGSTLEVSSLLYWQDAKENQHLRDYLLLNRELYHEGFRTVAGAMQATLERLKRKRFIVHDALKQPMMGWHHNGFFVADESWPLALAEDRAGSGHIGVSSLLNVPGMDGLITPHDYQARGVGGIFEPEGSADSTVLRGKYFLAEMDTRTYTGTDPIFPAKNDREFAALTWRNLATAWTRGFHAYWMDVHQDWFGNDALHAIINRQVQAIKASLEWKHETVPGIAVILDDEAILETNGNGAVMNEQIMWALKQGLARCGVPYRVYLFDDLKLDNFPDHRVFYFPNLYRVDNERLTILRQRVLRDGRVVVWGPGSGISNGEKIGVEAASQLTGFEFELLPVNYPRRTLLADFSHPITRGLGADTVLGGTLSYGPVLYPQDGQSLGQAWAKLGRNLSGLAVKNFGKGAAGAQRGVSILGAGDWVSVFTTATPLPAEMWRNLARLGGAHVYTQSNDILLADSTIVALHSLKSERKQIDLPGVYDVYDVVTGKLVQRNLHTIVFRHEAPDTRVFRLRTPTVSQTQ